MAFNKIKSISMTDIFVKEIKRMILSGELAVGEKLPPEREIAKEMGVSLAVVNAGITKLHEMGFLGVEPRKAVYVEDYLKNGTLRTMVEIIDFTDHSIDDDLLELIVHIRSSIEQIVFSKACKNHTEKDLSDLTQIVDQFASTNNKDELSAIGYEFYHLAALNCGNPFYSMHIQTFRDIYVFFIRYSLENKLLTREWLCDYYRSLIEGIRTGDVESTNQLIVQEIGAWTEKFRNSDKFKRGRK